MAVDQQSWVPEWEVFPDPQTGARVTRLTYEYIGKDPKTVLPAARQAGFIDIDALMPYHRRLLQPDAPFN